MNTFDNLGRGNVQGKETLILSGEYAIVLQDFSADNALVTLEFAADKTNGQKRTDNKSRFTDCH